MNKKLVLIGAGSATFGPTTFNDLNRSKILAGSTITLLDIDKDKLQMVFEVVSEDNKKIGNKFNIESTYKREEALKGADFIINATEHGDRFELRWQDNNIPKNKIAPSVLKSRRELLVRFRTTKNCKI